MATTAQILANRENSKLSTGPRTPDGKAISSSNSRTHGLNAADPVLPNEDRNLFNELLEQYKSEWTPATAHQEFLVSQMTGAQWKLNRIERMETEMFAALDDLATAFTGKETAAGFARLERYRATLERTYHRCVRELRAARKEESQFKAKTTQAIEQARLNFLAQRNREALPPNFREILDQVRREHTAKMEAEKATASNNPL